MSEMSETNKRPKGSRQWLAILLYALTGAAGGLVIVHYIDTITEGGPLTGMHLLLFLLLFVLLYAAMLIQTVIHEAGHLVFGLATGYRFVSFRIYSWMWLKEDGRLRCRRLSIAGTGGQCLMGPPELKDGRMPVLLYNFGGAIMNLLASAVFFGLSLATPPAWVVTPFLRLLAVIGVMFAIINGLPLRMGPVDNDGRNALSLLHSEEATRAFWIQLKVAELQAAGVRVRDMPAAWFAVPDDEAMRNPIIAAVGALCCSRLMDEERYAEADALMEHLLSIESGIIGVHRAMLTCDRLYLELLGENRPEALQALMTKEQQAIMKAMKDFPPVLRTQYARALLADRDEKQAQELEARFERSAARYPYPQEMASERELMQLARERARSGGAAESETAAPAKSSPAVETPANQC